MAANQKGMELLNKSPYKDQSVTAQAFFKALQDRAKELPNLISAHLGDRVPTDWTLVSATAAQPAVGGHAGNTVVALPLGGRIKVEPWKDQLRLIKSKPAGTVGEHEKMPFEITAFVLYLTRQGTAAPGEAPKAASAKSDVDAKP